MTSLSENKPSQRRRRFSREFKARVVSQCREPGASVSRIALDHRLNANMLRRWIREHQDGAGDGATGFVPVSLPAARVDKAGGARSGQSIRIEVPRAGGPVVIEWPVEQAHECLALLRELLS